MAKDANDKTEVGVNFALVSTTDTMGEGFPSFGVLVFATEKEAIQYAVQCILKHDPLAEYVEDEGVYTYGDEHYDQAVDLLAEWQSGLDTTEYFHVLPILKPDA